MAKECTLCDSELERETGLCPACHRAIRYVLLPTLGAPIPLIPESLVTFGRSEDCTIRISDRSVSRLHALVDWEGSRPIVRDQSRHGTFVNGRPADAHFLEADDEVRMGGFQFTVHDRWLGERGGEPSVATQTGSFLALQGRVTPGSLSELVQGLALSRRTGRLYVTSPEGERSWLSLREGVPARALWGREASGGRAAMAVLSTSSGRFVFCDEDAPTQGQEVKTPLVTLLFEVARRRDEASRAATVAIGRRRAAELRASALAG